MEQMTKRIITACHLDHKCDPSDHFCPNDSDLGKAAIARASELCPSVIGWDCEEWNGGEEFSYVNISIVGNR